MSCIQIVLRMLRHAHVLVTDILSTNVLYKRPTNMYLCVRTRVCMCVSGQKD